MPKTKTLEQYYQQDPEAYLKVVWNAQRKPLVHDKLVQRYIDLKGNVYYGFPKELSLPVERLGELQKYMQYISKGLTAEEDKEIDDALAKVAMSDMKDTDKKIKMGAIWAEKDRRRNMCIHTELFYNYLAVQWVRQDEHPEYFNIEIQHEKVVQFKEEVKQGGSYFFFQQPEFKKLNDLLTLTASEWTALWQESLIQQSLLKEVLKIYSSTITSASKKKTSKGN